MLYHKISKTYKDHIKSLT